jgi:hypothetical protein
MPPKIDGTITKETQPRSPCARRPPFVHLTVDVAARQLLDDSYQPMTMK